MVGAGAIGTGTVETVAGCGQVQWLFTTERAVSVTEQVLATITDTAMLVRVSAACPAFKGRSIASPIIPAIPQARIVRMVAMRHGLKKND